MRWTRTVSWCSSIADQRRELEDGVFVEGIGLGVIETLPLLAAGVNAMATHAARPIGLLRPLPDPIRVVTAKAFCHTIECQNLARPLHYSAEVRL